MEPKPRHPILNYDFLSLREHVEDVVISNVLMLALLAVGVWSHRRRKHDELKMVDKRAPLSLFEKVLVVTLGVSFFLNLFYKAGLGWVHLASMLFPCHVLSLSYVYILCSQNTKRATYIFNFIVFYTHNTALALLFPDMENVKFFLQREVFWIQHVTLLLTPYLLVWNRRFELYRGEKHGFDFFMKAIAAMFLFHINFHLVPGIFTGINLSYLLWPPNAATIWQGRLYKYKMAALLTVCACLAGYPALWGVQWARGLYDRSFGVSKSTKTANKAPNGKMVAGGKRKN
jgi:hypothetical protein